MRWYVPYQSAASVQVSRSYEVRSSAVLDKSVAQPEYRELYMRVNPITGFGVAIILSAFLRKPRPRIIQ